MDDEVAALQPPPPAGKLARRSRTAGAALDAADEDEISRADRIAAARARTRLSREPAVELEPDRAIARVLLPGERLLAFRAGAALDRRATEAGRTGGLAGDLYLTSTRLVFLGRVMVSYPLADLVEVALSDSGLLLLLGDGSGARLGVDWPQLLRVELAAARLAAAG